MSVYTQAVLCWGIKIDEELVDENVVGDEALSEHGFRTH